MVKHGSEVANIAANTSKIQKLIGVINDKYFITDMQHPDDAERKTYSNGCGELFAFMQLIEDCIDNIAKDIEPLMREV